MGYPPSTMAPTYVNPAGFAPRPQMPPVYQPPMSYGAPGPSGPAAPPVGYGPHGMTAPTYVRPGPQQPMIPGPAPMYNPPMSYGPPPFGTGPMMTAPTYINPMGPPGTPTPAPMYTPPMSFSSPSASLVRGTQLPPTLPHPAPMGPISPPAALMAPMGPAPVPHHPLTYSAPTAPAPTVMAPIPPNAPAWGAPASFAAPIPSAPATAHLNYIAPDVSAPPPSPAVPTTSYSSFGQIAFQPPAAAYSAPPVAASSIPTSSYLPYVQNTLAPQPWPTPSSTYGAVNPPIYVPQDNNGNNAAYTYAVRPTAYDPVVNKASAWPVIYAATHVAPLTVKQVLGLGTWQWLHFLCICGEGRFPFARRHLHSTILQVQIPGMGCSNTDPPSGLPLGLRKCNARPNRISGAQGAKGILLM